MAESKTPKDSDALVVPPEPATPPISRRIHIGGIDPICGLTSQMVLDRLPKSVENVHLGRSGLHCTVVDEAQHAVIQRMFHNVKWKQCKLVVQDAKVDFLTRLEQERAARNNPVTDGSSSSSPKPPVQHRHWRVKRRFGAPVILVDTHPKVVSSWSDFRLNRAKKHYQNRSIHLKFSENSDSFVSHGESSVSDDPSIEEEESTGAYAWSSDDDDRDLDDASNNDTSHEEAIEVVAQNAPSHNDVSETSGSSEDESNKSGSSEETVQSTRNSTKQDAVEQEPENVDLSRDVEMNQSIFAQLFPDSANGIERNKPREATTKRKMTTSMIRYDPTNQDAQAKYELSDQEAEAQTTKGADMEVEDHIEAQDEPDPAAEADALLPQDQASYVYEQSKLESVFKESREQLPHLQSQQGAFSFGFDLAAAPVPDESANQGSVFLCTTTNTTAVLKNLPEASADSAGGDSLESVSSTDSNVVDNDGPTLFEFPSEELLDSLTRKYYFGFEDGRRIAEDLEGWRKDPKVREDWLERRAALTQDWKRKRKAAIAQRKQRQDKHHKGRPR